MNQNRLKQLFTFLEQNPKDPFVLFAIAKEYEKLKELDQALAYYLKLTTDSPNYVGTYYHLGKLYEQLNQFEAAYQTYETGMNVAKAAGDRHALGELAEAKMAIEED